MNMGAMKISQELRWNIYDKIYWPNVCAKVCFSWEKVAKQMGKVIQLNFQKHSQSMRHSQRWWWWWF